MRYEVIMNNNYLNSFKDYSKAKELQEQMQRKFPKARVQIIHVQVVK